MELDAMKAPLTIFSLGDVLTVHFFLSFVRRKGVGELGGLERLLVFASSPLLLSASESNSELTLEEVSINSR
jgi:hypothetical protein